MAKLGKFITVATAVITLLSMAGCSNGNSSSSGSSGALGEGHGPITFAQGKDTTGKLQPIIDKFNAAHPGEEVKFVELPESADDQRTAMVQDLQAGAGTYDVLGLDVTWTAEFAARGWLLPLTDVKTDGLFPATVASGTYNGTLYAAPYETNGGLLYYRSDLVKTPPTTWADMINDCSIATANNMGCYAGQYAQYEGLTVNFAEAVNSAGGSLLDKDGNVSLNTPQAKAGLDFILNGFKDGYIPKDAITYQEEESRRAFQQGKLLFLNNWPYVYDLAQQAGSDSVVQGKFAIAPLPGENGVGASTLGGYNMAIAKTTKYPATAQEFINYMISADTQRSILVDMGMAPTQESLYDDATLQSQIPYLKVLKQSLESAVSRPMAVNYSEFSTDISETIYKAIQNGTDSTTVLADLQTSLQKIVDDSK